MVVFDAMFMFGGSVYDPMTGGMVPSGEAWRYRLASNRWTPLLLGADHIHPRHVLSAGYDAETHQILVLDAEGPEYADFRIINYDAHSLDSQALCHIDFDEEFPRTEVVGLGDGHFALIRANDSAWQAWRFSIQSGQVVFLGLAEGERELLAAPFLSDFGLHVPLRGGEGPEIATLETADFLESSGAPSCN